MLSFSSFFSSFLVRLSVDAEFTGFSPVAIVVVTLARCLSAPSGHGNDALSVKAQAQA